MTHAIGIDWDAQPLGVETDAAIARRLGCSHVSVWQARLRRGIPTAGKAGALIDMHASYADDPRCQAVVQAHPDGLTLEQIGELMGVTHERVRQIEAEALSSFRARCELAGITEDDVLEMLARRER